MDYDAKLKDKRDQISSFTASYVQIYTQPNHGAELAEMMNSMLTFIELKFFHVIISIFC